MEKKFNADLDTVYALLTQAKWLEARSLEQGELSAKCTAKKTGAGLQVRMQRRLHRDLNAIIAKVINPDSDIEIVENWTKTSGLCTASYEMTIVGKPIVVTAAIELKASGKGCVYRITHQAKAKVPLIGGVIEKFVFAEAEKSFAAELDYLAAYLKQSA